MSSLICSCLSPSHVHPDLSMSLHLMSSLICSCLSPSHVLPDLSMSLHLMSSLICSCLSPSHVLPDLSMSLHLMSSLICSCLSPSHVLPDLSMSLLSVLHLSCDLALLLCPWCVCVSTVFVIFFTYTVSMFCECNIQLGNNASGLIRTTSRIDHSFVNQHIYFVLVLRPSHQLLLLH